MTSRPWLLYALLTMALWGVWGAFAGLPVQNGFPETLVYCVWALTMIPPALYALWRINWRLQTDRSSVLHGSLIGLLGAGGQMVLFHAVKTGPAYLIFPVIALSPVITIGMAYLLLKERTGALGVLGILLSLVALPLFDYSSGTDADGFGVQWFVLSLGVLVAWGVQSYAIRLANTTMTAESIFVYMTVTGLLLMPVAVWMTDFAPEINWGADGPWLAAAIQILNSVGALLLVYAFRTGKAIVVSPMINAGAPLMTAVISMVALGAVPSVTKIVAIALATVAALLLALQPEG